MSRPLAIVGRALPQGWIDLLRQFALFGGAYWLYGLVRGEVDGRAATAFENARHIVNVEKALGLFVEPSVHAWATAQGWAIDFASWMYVNSHFAITTVALAFLYLRRNPHFYFVRNMFMVAMGIALVGYLLFPTAPPRFLPELGFSDSVADLTGVDAKTLERALQPVRRGAVDARLLRADDRALDGLERAARLGSRAVARVPVRGRLRRRRDRQPLVVRRLLRSGDGGGLGARGPGAARPREAAGVGVEPAAAPRRAGMIGDPVI